MNVYSLLFAEYKACDNKIVCRVRVNNIDHFMILARCESNTQAEQIANNFQSAYDRVLWNDKLKSGFFNETNFA